MKNSRVGYCLDHCILTVSSVPSITYIHYIHEYKYSINICLNKMDTQSEMEARLKMSIYSQIP